MEGYSKPYLDKYDIMKRYDVGTNKAIMIIRGIKDFCGGGALPSGKILVQELEYWESNRGVKPAIEER